MLSTTPDSSLGSQRGLQLDLGALCKAMIPSCPPPLLHVPGPSSASPSHSCRHALCGLLPFSAVSGSRERQPTGSERMALDGRSCFKGSQGGGSQNVPRFFFLLGCFISGSQDRKVLTVFALLIRFPTDLSEENSTQFYGTEHPGFCALNWKSQSRLDDPPPFSSCLVLMTPCRIVSEMCVLLSSLLLPSPLPCRCSRSYLD